MPIGISLQLFNGNTPQANLTGIQALWWDVTEPKDASRPVGKSVIVTTDASGFIKLDLSNVTGLSLGDFGFLTLYKLDAGNHQDSLVFSGKVVTSDVVGGVDMYYYDSGWTRPAEWLALPVVGNTEEKVVGLYQVLPESSFIAVICEGNYTVDWGDGTVENFAGGVQAQRLYDYTNVALNGTEITVGSLTYKQTIVTITPQAGHNLTSVNVGAMHTSKTTSHAVGWLDLLVSSPSLTALTVTGASILGLMEQFRLISTHTVTNFSFMLGDSIALRSVFLAHTSAVTDLGYLFYGCSSLQTIPLMDTSAATSVLEMFSGCSSLQTIPLIDTSAATSFASVFFNCRALQAIPLIDTSAGTSFASMFSGCSSLQTVPLIDTGQGTSFASMFLNCRALQTIPLIDTGQGTTLSSLFNGCLSLQSVPLLDASAALTLSSTFGSPALSRGALSGTKNTVSYANCKLSATALNEIYTNLATVTAKTITVTGNWGTASDNPAIATAKGWTVTG